MPEILSATVIDIHEKLEEVMHGSIKDRLILRCGGDNMKQLLLVGAALVGMLIQIADLIDDD